jgi:hypothetical protein
MQAPQNSATRLSPAQRAVQNPLANRMRFTGIDSAPEGRVQKDIQPGQETEERLLKQPDRP